MSEYNGHKIRTYKVGGVSLYKSKDFTFEGKNYKGGLNVTVRLLNSKGMVAGRWNTNDRDVVSYFAKYYALAEENPEAKEAMGVDPYLDSKLIADAQPCPMKEVDGYYATVDMPGKAPHVYITRTDEGLHIRRRRDRSYKTVQSVSIFVYCDEDEPYKGQDENILLEDMIGSLLMEETAALKAEGSSKGNSTAEELFGSQGVKEDAPQVAANAPQVAANAEQAAPQAAPQAKAEQSAPPAAAPTTPPLPELNPINRLRIASACAVYFPCKQHLAPCVYRRE